MTDISERDLDLLVDTIANRVRDRLQTDTSSPVRSDGRPAHHSDCAACVMPLTACEGCGLNPINVSSKWSTPSRIPDARGMASYIDHTLLKPESTRQDIETLCRDALTHRFFSVCVNSTNVRLASSLLKGSEVQVCAVVGFPLGAGTSGAKAFETREAIRCGANEIDMVLNIGALRSRDYALVTDDIRKVVQAASGKVVKVILETGMLTLEQKTIACALSKVAGATFVKTSTGFGPGGATPEDIAMMRSIVGSDLGVKASGGVRSYADAVNMLKAGASRLGASSSVAIVTGGKGSSGY
jgi:deoxyribose-phosphate aldolase